MEFKKRSGVNYDYILALKKDGNGVKVVQYPIERHDCEIDKAIECFYNEDCDADAIYNAVSSCLYNQSYSYCLDHEYTDSYIDDILPVNFDAAQYRKHLGEILSEKLESKIRRLPSNIRTDLNKLREIAKEIRRENYPNIKKTKRNLLNKVLPFIYASDYEDALFIHGIEKECIVYSSERPGDGRGKNRVGYHVEHKVNEDISIKVMTNFCYGSSTYFNVVVTYKGIKLLPYSLWVKYYYAGYNQLLRYTRSYARRRDSWHHCMNFLESFINSAIDDSESFIHNEVLTEIHDLMEGLERIMAIDDKSFEEELAVRNNTGDSRYIGIIGVRDANEYDGQLYNINPKECSMIYRMEKISSALRFLENLRKMEFICSEVSSAIERIIEMNKIILPEVESAIPPVEEEIESIKRRIVAIEKDLSFIEYWFNYHKDNIDWEYKHDRSGKTRKEIEEAYEKRKPKYRGWKESLENLRTNLWNQNSKLSKREDVLKRLDSYKELILRYTR